MNISLNIPFPNKYKCKSPIEKRREKDIELLQIMEDNCIVYSEDEKENLMWARDNLIQYLLDSQMQCENTELSEEFLEFPEIEEIKTPLKQPKSFSFEPKEKDILKKITTGKIPECSSEEIDEYYKIFKEQLEYKNIFVYLEKILVRKSHSSQSIQNFFDNFEFYKEYTDNMMSYYLKLKDIKNSVKTDLETKSIVEIMNDINTVKSEQPVKFKKHKFKNKLETPEEVELFNKYIKTERYATFDRFFVSDILIASRKKRLLQKITDGKKKR